MTRHIRPRPALSLHPTLHALQARVQLQGGERSTTLNELLEAVLLAVEPAVEHFDASKLPRRGRWGSQQADRYIAAIADRLLAAFRAVESEPDQGAEGYRRV